MNRRTYPLKRGDILSDGSVYVDSYRTKASALAAARKYGTGQAVRDGSVWAVVERTRGFTKASGAT